MSQLAKQKLIVLFASVALIFAFVGFLIANKSVAWFSENNEANAKGLSVNAKVSSNIIIAKTVEEIMSNDLSVSVNFNGTARTNMIAVTHDENVPDTYLKYLTNHYAVDHETGNVKNGMELEFADVPTTDNEPYFIDYTVYIASAFEPLDITSLKANIVIPKNVDSLHPYFNAASIDFYVDSVSEEGYRGTTSVADNINGTQRASIELFPTGGTVPLNTEGYVTVIMRCYFDGALQDTKSGKAYINSYTVKSDGVVIGVAFWATDTQKAD